MFFMFQGGVTVAKTAPFSKTYEEQMKVVASPKTSASKRTMAAFVVANTLSLAGPENTFKVISDINKILKASEIRSLSDADRLNLRAAAILAGEGSPQAAMHVQKRLDAIDSFDESLSALKAVGTYMVNESKEGNKRLTNIFKWAYSIQPNVTQSDVDDVLTFARSLPEDKRMLYYVGAMLMSDHKAGLDAYTITQITQDNMYEEVNNYINDHGLRRAAFPPPKEVEKKDTEPEAAVTGFPSKTVISSKAPAPSQSDIKHIVDWRPGSPGIGYTTTRANQDISSKEVDLTYTMANIMDSDWSNSSNGYLKSKYPVEEQYLAAGRKALSLLFGTRLLAEEYRQSNNTPDKEFIDLMKTTLADARVFLTDTYFNGDSAWFSGQPAQAKSLYLKAMNGDYNAFLDFITIWKTSPTNPMQYSAQSGNPSITINKNTIRRVGQYDVTVNMPNLSENLRKAINGERMFVPAYFNLGGEIYERVKKSTTFTLDDQQNVVATINDQKVDHPGIHTLSYATGIFFNGYGHFVRLGPSYSQIDKKMGAELGIFKRDLKTGYSDPLKLMQTQDNKSLNLDYNFMIRAPSFKERMITTTQIGLEGIESLFMRGNFFLLDMRLQTQYRPAETPSHLLVFVPRFLIPLSSTADEKGHYVSPAVTTGYDLSRHNVFIQPELRAMYGGLELYGAWQNILGDPHTEAKVGLRIDPEEFGKLFKSAGITPIKAP